MIYRFLSLFLNHLLFLTCPNSASPLTSTTDTSNATLSNSADTAANSSFSASFNTTDTLSRAHVEYRILDCNPAQEIELRLAITLARAEVEPAIAELSNPSPFPSRAFELMFGRSPSLRPKILKVLQQIQSLPSIKGKRPLIFTALTPPTFICLNPRAPTRIETGFQQPYKLCQRAGQETWNKKQPYALTFDQLGGIIFCQPFFEQPIDHAPDDPDFAWPDFCPNLISGNRWGVRAPRIIDTQKSTVLHELVHFYLPCSSKDFVLDKMLKRPEEVYGLGECVKAPVSLRERNPNNYAFYAAMVEQNCTEFVDVYASPWNRKRGEEGGRWLGQVGNGTLGWGANGTLGVEGGNETLEEGGKMGVNGSVGSATDGQCPNNGNGGIIVDPMLDFEAT